jgi:hypothetical protein
MITDTGSTGWSMRDEVGLPTSERFTPAAVEVCESRLAPGGGSPPDTTDGVCLARILVGDSLGGMR